MQHDNELDSGFSSSPSSIQASIRGRIFLDFAGEIAEIAERWEEAKWNVSFGKWRRVGPYYLGSCPLQALSGYLNRSQAKGCLGTLPLGPDAEGRDLVAVYMWGDCGWVHQRLSSYIRDRWSRSMIDDHDDCPHEEQRALWDARRAMVNEVLVMPTSMMQTYNRRSGQMGPKAFVPGLCNKKADFLWHSGVGQRSTEGLIEFFTILEVVHHIESPSAAFLEGLLWSQQGDLPDQPVKRALNTLVLVMIPPGELLTLCKDRKEAAFLLLLFTAANQQGSGSIDVWFMNSTEALQAEWNVVFDQYRPTLKDGTIRDHGDVEEVSLPYRLFGPARLVSAWQEHSFKLTFTGLAEEYVGAQDMEDTLRREAEGD